MCYIKKFCCCCLYLQSAAKVEESTAKQSVEVLVSVIDNCVVQTLRCTDFVSNLREDAQDIVPNRYQFELHLFLLLLHIVWTLCLFRCNELCLNVAVYIQL